MSKRFFVFSVTVFVISGMIFYVACGYSYEFDLRLWDNIIIVSVFSASAFAALVLYFFNHKSWDNKQEESCLLSMNDSRLNRITRSLIGVLLMWFGTLRLSDCIAVLKNSKYESFVHDLPYSWLILSILTLIFGFILIFIWPLMDHIKSKDKRREIENKYPNINSGSSSNFCGGN